MKIGLSLSHLFWIAMEQCTFEDLRCKCDFKMHLAYLHYFDPGTVLKMLYLLTFTRAVIVCDSTEIHIRKDWKEDTRKNRKQKCNQSHHPSNFYDSPKGKCYQYNGHSWTSKKTWRLFWRNLTSRRGIINDWFYIL